MTKKSIVFLSIFLATAVLIVGGVLWYSNEVKKEAEMVQKKNNEKQIAQKEQQDSKNSNVKTYQNKEYGFEVKYPENWEINQEDATTFFDPKDGNISPLLEVTFEKGTSEKWVNDFRKNKSSKFTQIVSQEKYQMGNIIGMKIVHSTDIGLNKNIFLIQDKNAGNLIVFSFLDSNYSSYYEKVVQSFQWDNLN